jgi:hypothetical protein
MDDPTTPPPNESVLVDRQPGSGDAADFLETLTSLRPNAQMATPEEDHRAFRGAEQEY